MRALTVVLVLLLSGYLLGRLRLGGRVRYSEAGFLVRVRVGPFRPQVFPARKKAGEKPPREEKKREQEPTREAKSKTPVTAYLPLVKEALPLVWRALGRLKRKLCINRLDLSVRVGGDDPADVVMTYGYVNTAIGLAVPLLEQNFDLRERDLRAGLDFDAEKTELELEAELTFTLGQLVTLAFWLGFSLLRVFLRWRKARKQKMETHTKQETPVTEKKEAI